MTSFVQNLFRNSLENSRMGRHDSMNDLSMGAHADADMHLRPQPDSEAPSSPTSEGAPRQRLRYFPNMLASRLRGVQELAHLRLTLSVASPKSQGPKENVWQSTFNPGRNYKTQTPGRTYYDHVDEKSPSKTTWEMVLQSQNAGAKPTEDDRKSKFKQMDNNGDGFIDAKDLRSFLGPAANVESLIKQADKNNDGKVDYNEFCNLMRTSMTKREM